MEEFEDIDEMEEEMLDEEEGDDSQFKVGVYFTFLLDRMWSGQVKPCCLSLVSVLFGFRIRTLDSISISKCLDFFKIIKCLLFF